MNKNLTLLEKIPKQRCTGLVQTPPQLFNNVIKNDQEIQQSNFYVNSNFRLWLEILKMESVTFLEECSHLKGDFFSV